MSNVRRTRFWTSPWRRRQERDRPGSLNDQMQLELQTFGPQGSEAEVTGPACEARPVPALVLPGEEIGFLRQRR